MALFVTSDLHFNHKNIVKYQPKSRGFFLDVFEMNEEMIRRWNEVVDETDEVVVIGDFFMGLPTDIPPVLNRLNGIIHLIPGNHDNKYRLKVFEENGVIIHHLPLVIYQQDGITFILTHYPPHSPEYEEAIKGFYFSGPVIILYGHIHEEAPKGFVGNTYHVGVDTNGLRPINIKQIIKEYNE